MLSSGEKVGEAEEIMSDITKRAISASLKKLLCEKDLNKITVQDIADDCGINRQTFYYHFKDIKELFEWLYKFEGHRKSFKRKQNVRHVAGRFSRRVRFGEKG